MISQQAMLRLIDECIKLDHENIVTLKKFKNQNDPYVLSELKSTMGSLKTLLQIRKKLQNNGN